MKLVFTGHFHANDISKYESSQSKIIYDIETGSAVTYPHSYRIIELTKNKANIKTKNITNIKYKDITDFYAYSKEKTRNLLGNYFNAYWKQFVDLYKDYDEATKAEIKTAFISAVFAHYKGDEKISAQDRELLSKFADSEDFGLIVIAQLMSMIYNDTEPQDLNLEIDF